MSNEQELDGIALKIYVALANSDKPLGPREVTRIAELSSPSVAYRNLQKLEELSLIEKNVLGEYTVKQKQRVKGHFWVGDRLFPRPLFYASFFIGVLSIELVDAAVRAIGDDGFSYDFILLIIVTSVAAAIFLAEGALPKLIEHRNSPAKNP